MKDVRGVSLDLPDTARISLLSGKTRVWSGQAVRVVYASWNGEPLDVDGVDLSRGWHLDLPPPGGVLHLTVKSAYDPQLMMRVLLVVAQA